MNSDLLVNQIVAKLKSSTQVVIPISGRLDADGVGCALIFTLKLRELGKSVRCICDSPLVFPYTEFPGANLVEVVDIPTFDPGTAELVIVTDTGSPEKLLRDSRPAVPVSWPRQICCINIDHHQNSRFGDLNFVDESAPSTGFLVYRILESLGTTRESATLLYAGLVGDTMFFKSNQTNEKTFTFASTLLSLGADQFTARIWTESCSQESLVIISDLLKRVQFNHQYQYASLSVPLEYCISHTEEDLEIALGILKDDLVWRIREAKFNLTLRESSPGFVKGSLRGNKVPLDLRIVARDFDGGGHAHGCGFKINAPLAQASTLVSRSIATHYSEIFTPPTPNPTP